MKRFLSYIFVVFAILGILLSGCTRSGSVGAPLAAENFLQLDSKLRQGVSTKMEVQHLLGTPSGFGDALFPKMADIHRLLGIEMQKTIPGIRYTKSQSNHDVWLYQNMEFNEQSASRKQFGMNQKILLVFFNQQIYEGYLWYIGSGVSYVK